MGHGAENDNVSLLSHAEDADQKGDGPMVEVELAEVTNIQAELTKMHARLWESDDMTEEDAEEVERQANLLKIKMTAASDKIKEWGMKTGLERMLAHESIPRWHEDKKAPVNEFIILAGLLPIALIFMSLVLGASTVHFDESVPIQGNLFPLDPTHPIIWPMGHASAMVEARIQIQSDSEPGHSSGGHHRRRNAYRHQLPSFMRSSKLLSDSSSSAPDASTHVPGHDTTTEPELYLSLGEDNHTSASDSHGVSNDHNSREIVVEALLVEFKNSDWMHGNKSLEAIKASAAHLEILGQYDVRAEEQTILLEFELKSDPLDQYFIMISHSKDPMAVAINMHSLGPTGSIQVGISAFIMVILFGLIMTEVLHRTMAAMIGATLCMITLAVQNRVPSLTKVVGWMDHGTLGLLWGMMLIVGITMRTGVFEWTGVLACKMSGGNKTKLLLLLCLVTAILSAFLDNVTTILLIAPVTCKLCKLVNIDPRPYLISEAIFSNIGGTSTMIGDPPNIIIGNLLAKYLDFNAFLFNLGPGVILTSPFAFYYLVWYFKDGVKGHLSVDIPKLQKMYPITDRPLLIKCGVVLGCVICSFFLHPVTHLDPAWIAIMGAVWLLVAFDMHHCHEALHAVEWDTLLFFAALFVVVEGVGELGLLRFIANTLSGMVATVPVEGRQYFSLFLICWASAIFSAFVDNIPFTATMVPVMMQMVETVPGISIEPLAWALAFGACFGGNGTLIGASANIVMASKAETEGFHISFVDFFRIGFPVMLLTVLICNIYLFLLNAAFWQSHAGA
uniref:Citrate transporter-like domain-containing protein n=1 Tax=Hanusia phi TaxID=3032 RepID=A0A7S0HFN8_9CRYP